MTRDDIVNKAKSYIKYWGNPNQFTKWYWKDNKTHNWCGAFVKYIFKHDLKCDWLDSCSNFSYVPTIVKWAIKMGYWNTDWKKAKQGDLVVYNWHPEDEKNCSHVGIVKKVKDKSIVSIEGNTTNALGKKNCVAQKTRNKKYIKGVIILPYQFNLTRVLKKGCKGNDVLELQKELNKRGYKDKNEKKLAEDKKFGSNTAYAVGNFQKDNKLTADKEVGKNTAHKLGWLYIKK